MLLPVVAANLLFFFPRFFSSGGGRTKDVRTGGAQQEKHKIRCKVDRTKGPVGNSNKFKGKRRVFDRQGSMRVDNPMKWSTEEVVLGPNIPTRPGRATPCRPLSQRMPHHPPHLTIPFLGPVFPRDVTRFSNPGVTTTAMNLRDFQVRHEDSAKFPVTAPSNIPPQET